MRFVDLGSPGEAETGTARARAVAGPSPLRCRRFAGDPVLLAVVSGRLRLAARGTPPRPAPVHSRGPAVRKVQEALMAAGCKLPRYGADGIFGPETGSAVTCFKTARRITPSDPVVGPATMRALDALCPGTGPGPGGGPFGAVRVAVVGGGFAGLMAAWSLESGGIRTTVFEATGRLGGRVQTDSALIPGKIVEAGAELIGRNHPTWIRLAKTFGLTLTPVSEKKDYKGLKVRLRFGDTDVSQRDQERIERELQPVLQRIGDEAREVDALRPWTAPNAVTFDRTSVAKRLSESDMVGSRSGLARRYFVFVSGNDQCAPPSRQSYLGLLAAVSAHRLGGDMLGYWKYTETHRCRGGNEQLARRLAAKLSDIRLNAPVTAIRVTDRSVTLTFVRNGTSHAETFDYVVLATPPSVWPRVDSTPPFRPGDFTMAHGPAVKFLSAFGTPFWKARGLAPSALWDRLGSVWEGTDKQPASKPGFGLSVYSGGPYVLDAPTYRSRLETIYPGYGANLRRSVLVDWPRRPWILTGYSIPAPGQVTTIARNLSRPFRGRLFFAGEQASPGFFGYMEGALQSGVFASYRIAAAVRAAHGSRTGP